MSLFGAAGILVFVLIMQTTYRVINESHAPPGPPIVQMLLKAIAFVLLPFIVMIAGMAMWQGVLEVLILLWMIT